MVAHRTHHATASARHGPSARRCVCVTQEKKTHIEGRWQRRHHGAAEERPLLHGARVRMRATACDSVARGAARRVCADAFPIGTNQLVSLFCSLLLRAAAPPPPSYTMSGSESGSEEEIEQTKFETADAGASHTYPQTASGVRKGGFMVIKGRPCKARRRAGGAAARAKRLRQRTRPLLPAGRAAIRPHASRDVPSPAHRPSLPPPDARLHPARPQVVDVSTSKTGKHGHAKCHFVALDIFTSRKMEELVPSSHNLEVRLHAVHRPPQCRWVATTEWPALGCTWGTPAPQCGRRAVLARDNCACRV